MITAAGLVLIAASLIELAAAGVIVYHVSWAIFALFERKGIALARVRIAEGVVTALGFSAAATLLKVTALQTWPQIRAFVFIYVLRTVLKRVFAWEQRSIEHRRSLQNQIAVLQ